MKLYNVQLYNTVYRNTEFYFLEVFKNMKNFDYAETRKIIIDGINKKISFDELRKKLPGLNKRKIKMIVFDVMKELDLSYTPFNGMLSRPQIKREPIPVSEDGTLNIMALMKEKSFDGVECQARCHVGPDKITLTIKPVDKESYKNKLDKESLIEFYRGFNAIKEEFERMKMN